MGQSDFFRLGKNLFVIALAPSNRRREERGFLALVLAHEMAENLLVRLRGNL